MIRKQNIKNIFLNMNFKARLCKHNHNILFNIEKCINVMNKLKNMYLNSILKEFLIYIEQLNLLCNITYYSNCNILKIKMDFKHNTIYKYSL